jgi:hypothetical protein
MHVGMDQKTIMETTPTTRKSCHLQPIHVRLHEIKCRLRLQMVAYATIFQIWMKFGFLFN